MAKYEELYIDQGSDVAVQIYLVNDDGSAKNLRSHSVAAKIKKTYNTPDSDAVSFTAGVQEPETDGIISLALTNSQTQNLKKGRHVYDVEINFTDSDGINVVERVLEGRIHVTPSVT